MKQEIAIHTLEAHGILQFMNFRNSVRMPALSTSVPELSPG